MALTKIKKQLIDLLSPPLATTSGGTGLANPGASGNVLTSDGVGFVSSPPAPAIGVGQTWQDLTLSKAYGVTYTNSTGKPIMVQVSAIGSSNNSGISGYVNNVNISQQQLTNGYASAYCVMIVPAGSTYRVDKWGASNLTLWAELR